MLLSEAIQVYIMAKTADGLSLRTLATYDRTLLYLLRFIGDKPIEEVTVQGLRAWLADLRTREAHASNTAAGARLSVWTIASYVTMTKAFFHWLAAEGMIQADPARRIKKAKGTREPKAVETEDLRLMFQATAEAARERQREAGELAGFSMFSMFPVVAFTQTTLAQANDLLVLWGHKMGGLARGNQGAVCHVLLHDGRPVAVTTASNLIAPVVGNAHWLTRENTIELSRLCAERSGLNRVMLRLWREFVFPFLGYQYAVSYQDADIHTGNTYRFDGWQRVSFSHSGPDTRSGRAGRNKWVWQWPPANNGLHPTVAYAEIGSGLGDTRASG